MVPEVRFRGYTDFWKFKNLSEIALIVKGEQLNIKNMIQSGQYYVLNGGVEPSGFTDKFNTLSGTVTISEGGNSCGYVVYNKENFWSGGHNYSLLNSKINNKFLYGSLKNKESEIMELRIGTGLPNIQKSSLSLFEIGITNNEVEQSKIGEFFKNIDNLITQTNNKLDKLKDVKKSLLNKMFPVEGKLVPEIRFKNFSENWDKNILSNLSSIVKGDQLNLKDMKSFGKYYVLNGGVVPSGYTDNFNTPHDTVTISEGGNSCGFVIYNFENFWSGGHNYSLLNSKLNNKFLYELLKSNEDLIMSLRIGTGLPNIQKSNLSLFEVKYSNNEMEQLKIAEFLTAVDKLITLTNKKLSKLKDIKKALLQKMFV